MAGIIITGNEINTQSGQITRSLFTAFDQIKKFQVWLAATPDATLLAVPYNMTQADINSIKSSFTDLNQLATIFDGTASLAVAKDFRTFSKTLIGPTY